MRNLVKILLLSTVLVGTSWAVCAETPCTKYDAYGACVTTVPSKPTISVGAQINNIGDMNWTITANGNGKYSMTSNGQTYSNLPASEVVKMANSWNGAKSSLSTEQTVTLNSFLNSRVVSPSTASSGGGGNGGNGGSGAANGANGGKAGAAADGSANGGKTGAAANGGNGGKAGAAADGSANGGKAGAAANGGKAGAAANGSGAGGSANAGSTGTGGVSPVASFTNPNGRANWTYTLNSDGSWTATSNYSNGVTTTLPNLDALRTHVNAHTSDSSMSNLANYAATVNNNGWEVMFIPPNEEGGTPTFIWSKDGFLTQHEGTFEKFQRFFSTDEKGKTDHGGIDVITPDPEKTFGDQEVPEQPEDPSDQLSITEGYGFDPVRLAIQIWAATATEEDLSIRRDINIKAGEIGEAVGSEDSSALQEAASAVSEATSTSSEGTQVASIMAAASLTKPLLTQATVDMELLNESSATGSSDDRRKAITSNRHQLLSQYVGAAIQIAEGMNAISNKFVDRAQILVTRSSAATDATSAYVLVQDTGRFVLFETLRGLALSSAQMGVQAARLLNDQKVEIEEEAGNENQNNQ